MVSHLLKANHGSKYVDVTAMSLFLLLLRLRGHMASMLVGSHSCSITEQQRSIASRLQPCAQSPCAAAAAAPAAQAARE
jgi:hypothetical protein